MAVNLRAGTGGSDRETMSRQRRGATVTGTGLVSWLWRPAGGLREIGWGDVALAAFLSLYAVVAVSGLTGIASPHSGPVAAVAVLAMTVPVAWERRAPAAAAAAVAVGAVANELVIGPMIRC